MPLAPPLQNFGMADTPRAQLILCDRSPGGSPDRQALARAAKRGTLVRIKRGAYVSGAVWAEMSAADRHLSKVHAFAASYPGVIFSHQSAALLLQLPLIGQLPEEVQVVSARQSGGRSEPGLRRWCVGILESEVTAIEPGIRCTSVARTLVDLALVQPFRFAVAPLDHALRQSRATVDELLQSVDARGTSRGRTRALRVVDFGDGLSMNPGESLSRAVICEFGYLAPTLQVEHPQPDGRTYFTDFEWLDLRQIGEFDGKGKYLKEEYLRGITPGEAVHEEKVREDILRSEGNGVFRWGWADAWGRSVLDAKLRAAGIPRVRRPVALPSARS